MEQEFLRKWFEYEDRGMLKCLLPGRDPYPWLPVGSDLRYLSINLGPNKYYLHRLIWQYHFGEIPDRVDHKDRNTSNNRIGNLRLCTAAENRYNSKRMKNNKSGAKGVVEHKKCTYKKWQAKITVNKKIISLGYFATVEEAGAAYARAAEIYAKEFANVG